MISYVYQIYISYVDLLTVKFVSNLIMGDDKKSGKSLDLTSDQFDAFKALYSTNVHLPSPKAPILDNITKFSEDESGIVIRKVYKPKVQETKDKPSTSASSSRFQPHQEPIKARERTVAKNVLTRMNNVKGPMSLLQRCMNDRIRIKVLTRNMAGIRGYCVGYLLAFDKHFNMALEDVTEVWTRKKHIKTPPLGPSEEVDVPIPRVRVRSIDKKTEECERFIKQMMMRGEHVAMVIATDH